VDALPGPVEAARLAGAIGLAGWWDA
jgi:hypothetical protein